MKIKPCRLVMFYRVYLILITIMLTVGVSWISVDAVKKSKNNQPFGWNIYLFAVHTVFAVWGMREIKNTFD